MKRRTDSKGSKKFQSNPLYPKRAYPKFPKIFQSNLLTVTLIQSGKQRVVSEIVINTVLFKCRVSNNKPVLNEAWKSDFQ